MFTTKQTKRETPRTLGTVKVCSSVEHTFRIFKFIASNDLINDLINDMIKLILEEVGFHG